MRKKSLLAAMLLMMCGSFIYADQAADKKADKEQIKRDALKDESVETHHKVTIGGVEISYKARTGTLVLRDTDGEPRATLFYVAYTKEGVEDYSRRPITYCFNGGPGSAAVWLHLGAFGPRKVALSPKGYGLLPYHLVDNSNSILDLTDLVFIDPVSTGYSRSAPGIEAKEFHGVDEDIKSVADFIRLYTTRFNRWESPKFLAGESYGTTRAAGLAAHLQSKNKMNMNGLLLISSILNFQTVFNNEGGNELPLSLFLPTFTATAKYHNKLPKELQEADQKQVLQDVEQFAINEYTSALMKGDKLSENERKQVVAKLAHFTGLSPAFIERENLRITPERFRQELLRDQRRNVGRFDSRFDGIDIDVGNAEVEYDPSADAVLSTFSAGFYDYVRNELKWQKDEEYRVLADVSPWNFGECKNKYLYVGNKLAETMTKNTHMNVFVAAGYYDMATPYYAAVYTFDHLGLDPTLRSHVDMQYYEAGHMMFIDEPSLDKLKKDISTFYSRVLAEQKIINPEEEVEHPEEMIEDSKEKPS